MTPSNYSQKLILHDFQIPAHSCLYYRQSDAIRSMALPYPPLTAGQTEFCLGTHAGTLHTSMAADASMKAVLSYFQSTDGKCCAIKFKITNTCGANLFLDHLVTSLTADGQAPNLAGAKVQDWQITRLSRQKNDIPGSFNLGTNDANSADATFLSMNTEAGAGITFNLTGTDCPEIFSEPAIYISNSKKDQAPGLFVGVLGQKKYLTDIVIQAHNDRQSLKTFDIRFLFDNCLFESDSSKETDWLIFRQAPSCWDAFDWFYETFAQQFNIPIPPKPAPSLYCSWYFYGPSFTEKDLDENLDFLKKNPMPFDVFLIDLGWFDDMGLWEPSRDWPSGMANAAEKIRAAGYEPGIWTSPFVIMADSPMLKKHPELAAKDFHGNRVIFRYKNAPAYALDPTCPFAEDYLTELFHRLQKWGYNYHKLDFLRSVEQNDSIRFYDRRLTRAEAYVRGMSIIQKALGKDGYIIACGGLFEASAGLVHSIRSGSDVRGAWYDNPEKTSGYLKRIKQNVFRNFYNRLWHTDPDALMLRIADENWPKSGESYKHLSVGSLNDDEAFTTVVNQFIGDGIVCFSERLKTVQKDRLDMLRHVIPVLESKTTPLDISHPECPSVYLTRVKPRCHSIGNTIILTVANWDDQEKDRNIDLSYLHAFENNSAMAIFEFYEQRFYGIKKDSDTLTVRIPAHGCRVFRLTEITDSQPKIIGTNLHITSGCQEITAIKAECGMIRGRLESKWNCPVTVTALFNPDNPEIVTQRVEPSTCFAIRSSIAAQVDAVTDADDAA